MIRRDILFNTLKLGRKAEVASGIVTDVVGYRNNAGYPCMYDKRAPELFNEFEAIFPMGVSENTRPMMSYKVKSKSLIHKSDKSIANSRVKLIERFDFDKIGKISEYLNKHRSLVMYFMAHSAYGAAIPTGRNVVRFLSNFNRLVDSYRYSSVSYLYYSKDKVTYPRGDLRYIIYFINMPQCIPILNRYKVDGMSVIFQIVSLDNTLSTKMITPIFNIVLMLSNYRENLFVIDGIDIRDQRPVNGEALLIARKTINKSIKSRNTFFLREEKRSEKRDDGGYIAVKPTKWEDVKQNITYATLDTSSTATYYYGTSYTSS